MNMEGKIYTWEEIDKEMEQFVEKLRSDMKVHSEAISRLEKMMDSAEPVTKENMFDYMFCKAFAGEFRKIIDSLRMGVNYRETKTEAIGEMVKIMNR